MTSRIVIQWKLSDNITYSFHLVILKMQEGQGRYRDQLTLTSCDGYIRIIDCGKASGENFPEHSKIWWGGGVGKDDIKNMNMKHYNSYLYTITIPFSSIFFLYFSPHPFKVGRLDFLPYSSYTKFVFDKYYYRTQ